MTAETRRPVAMLTHSYYEEDPRVRREAEALAASGRPVHVYALRQPGDAAEASIDGVDVHRLDVQRHQGAGLARYFAEYTAFFVRAGWSLARDHRRRRYSLVQVHTIPDALVFAALPLRLAGVPVVLDMHEAMPEFFRFRFAWADHRLTHALIRLQETASIAAADAVLTVNDALGDRLVALGTPPVKVTVVRNAPALARFDPALQPRRAFMEDGTVRLVYAGALSPIYELDVALEAMARIVARRPDLAVSLDLYGRDYAEVPLAARASMLGLAERVTFHGRIPIEAVPAAIAAADIGLAPTRRSEFTDFSLSTKLFEYAAMGKPVVASRLPMVERTFPPGTVETYRPGDADDLAAAILRLVDDPAGREQRVGRAEARVHELGWEQEAARYLDLIDGLISRSPAAPGRVPLRPDNQEAP